MKLQAGKFSRPWIWLPWYWRKKVAFVPGEAFGAPGYARFSFALGMEDLVDGVSRIGELVND